MKKLFLIVAVAIFSLGTVNAFAQETTTPATEETAVVEETVVDEVPASDTQLAEAKPMHQVLMQKFLEGGWEWMLPVLLCLVFGLAIAIERMLYLSLSTINSKKLIAQAVSYTHLRAHETVLDRRSAEKGRYRSCQGSLPQQARSGRIDLLSGSGSLQPGFGQCRESRRFLRFGTDRPHGVGLELDRSVHRT